ncbi:transferrin-binding protein-like solute binding protein [Moraxella oculi]|uniref:Transferrin-binding protein B n=1 Tax=Moraxella oculi TaxID=2940516 RepID=A0ABW8U6Q7_9GAMM
MNISTRKLLSVLVSTLLLSACASNKGNFGLDGVNSIKPKGPVHAVPQNSTAPTASQTDTASTSAAPSYEDEQGERRKFDAEKSEPALGYQVEIPRRVFAMKAPAAEDLKADITADKIKPINHKLEDFPKVFKLEDRDGYVDDLGVSYSHDGRHKDTTRDLKFVRSGYAIAEKTIQFNPRRGPDRKQDPAGQYGYVFYQGSNPATMLPTTTATYKGTWDFVTNAVSTRKSLPEGFTNDMMNYGPKGNTAGATSLDADFNRGRDEHNKDKPVGLTSEFHVNFSDKTMKGTLKQNHGATSEKIDQVITDRYTIDAKLQGNRFVGTAEAKNKEHELFGKDGALEGGFFGKKAQELAGKFLANDNSLFGVFAGKRNELSDDQLETKFDAISIDSKSLTKSDMDTFGQVSHLLIDGKLLSLLPKDMNSFAQMAFNDTRQVEHNGKKLSVTVCCNNLDYIKFGSYSDVDSSSSETTTILKDGKLFLVGERTAVSELPTGTAHYRGTWEGNIESKGVSGRRWSESATGAKSIFEVNFGSKTLTGKLIGNNGLEDNPILKLDGKIEGNGFSGKAKTQDKGFNLDSTGSSDTVHINADFVGGFYGPKATELGGFIHSNEGEDKVGIVFGGKRQTDKTQTTTIEKK